MSKETVQFVEMAREHQAQQLRLEKTYRQYCIECGAFTEHIHHERGEWEIQRCSNCGTEKDYRVR